MTYRTRRILSLLLLVVGLPVYIVVAVTVVGWAHGVLFIGLALLVLIAWLEKALPFRHAVMVMIAAVLPFGPFFIDGRLARDSEGG